MKELQEVWRNWRNALGKMIDTIASAVVDHFISTFVDDDFFGSHQDPHDYTQTVMKGIMSDDGLENIAASTEEITRTVENMDNINMAAILTKCGAESD